MIPGIDIWRAAFPMLKSYDGDEMMDGAEKAFAHLGL